MPRYLFIAIFGLLPFSILSQTTISGDFKNAPLQEVISELESQQGIVFSYTEDLLKDIRVSVSFNALPLEDGLSLIFEQTEISFEIIDEKYIVLKPKELELMLLCGTILNEEGMLLSFANILSPTTQRGTQSDEEGRFELSIKINPTDSMVISYVGYQSKVLTAEQLHDCPNVFLKLQSFSIPEVYIKEYITTGIEQSEELDHIILHPGKINVVPGLTEADVLQMVQILPGVQSIDESATGLHVRGGTPDQNLILWDGVPIYNSGHFFGMISAFNPYIVDQVNVYRGGFGAEYGGRVSSVIDIHSIEKIPERVKVNAGINFTHADASLVVPLSKQKSVFMLSGRRAYTDVIESPTYKKLSQRVFQKGKINEAQGAVEEDEGVDYNLNFNFADLNGKWLWKPNGKNDIAISAFRIFDKLDFSFENFEDEFQAQDNVNLDNLGASAQWKRQWNTNFSSSALLSYTKVKNNLEFLFGEGDSTGVDLASTQLNDIEDFSFKLDNTWSINNNFQLDFGYQWADLKVNRQWVFEEEEVDEILETNVLHSGHLTMNTQLSNKIRLKTGLRATYAGEQEKFFLEPRVALNYLPGKKWQFSASAGQYVQFISQAIELNDLGLNQEMWVLADEEDEIPIAKSIHYSTGFLFNSGTFQLEVEGFYKQLSGLTSFSPIFINNFQEDESEGTGTAYGVDLLLKKRWKNYQTWLSYSYGRVFYTFDIYSNNNPFPAPHDRPHSLTSMHQYNYKNWNFSLSWKLASGKVYTDAQDFFIEEEDAIPAYAYDEANENRLPFFHRLDASVLYRFTPKSNRFEGMFGISALNLYNRENILSREFFAFFDEEEETFQLETLDRPMLGFTPNIVLRLFWK